MQCTAIRNVVLPMVLLLWALPSGAVSIQWPTDGEVLNQVAARIRTFLAKGDSLNVDGITLTLPAKVRHFYQQREFQPAWVENDGVVIEAAVLLQTLERSEEEGLPTKDYPVAAIEHYLYGEIDKPQQLAKLDLLLTDAFLHYGRNVRSGRLTPRRAGGDWFLPYKRFDASPLLVEALQQHTMEEILAVLPPSHEGYRRLRMVLQQYRTVAAEGGWPKVDRGETLRLGSKGKRVAQLRQRLWRSGDFKDIAVAEPETFDADLNEAVILFQRRHGLKDDGSVGENTRAALNQSVEARIHQIEANMERWRWLPDELPEHYIAINMAGYDLDVIQADESTMTMRVIVGRNLRQTPVFTSDVTGLLLNPSWDVPPTIFREDILPQLRRNPARLEKLHLRLLYNGNELKPNSVDWSKVSAYHSPYVLHQDPGPKNPLGRIKFLLHDSDGIYLHDTPDRHLFEQPTRALSSGCIRLEHPIQLALYLLANPEQWDRASLETAIGLGSTQSLPLPEPMPIYFTYWTAWVDKEGVLQLRDDVYRRDRLILRLWEKNAT